MQRYQRTESWLPVIDYVGFYEVSDLGRVRSLTRVIKDKNGVTRVCPGKLLRLQEFETGHLLVSLSRDGKVTSRWVHHLVLEAFDRPRRPGEECRHGPGGPADNRWPEAICWGTNAENHLDKVRDGTLVQGEQQWKARLTEATVRECRLRHAAGETQKALAAEFRVAPTTIHNVVTYKTWKHVI